MPVVNVPVMRVGVGQGLMLVKMHIRGLTLPGSIVGMRVVRVNLVRVAVPKGLVGVRVPFSQVEPDPQAHQRGRHPKQQARRTGPDCQRNHHPEQWRD